MPSPDISTTLRARTGENGARRTPVLRQSHQRRLRFQAGCLEPGIFGTEGFRIEMLPGGLFVQLQQFGFQAVDISARFDQPRLLLGLEDFGLAPSLLQLRFPPGNGRRMRIRLGLQSLNSLAQVLRRHICRFQLGVTISQ